MLHTVKQFLAGDVPAAALSSVPPLADRLARATPCLGVIVGWLVIIVPMIAGVVLYQVVIGEWLSDLLARVAFRPLRWLVIIAGGCALFSIRKKALSVYAVLQLFFAGAMAWDAAAVPKNPHTFEFAGKLIGAVYLLVRSFDDWSRAFEHIKGAVMKEAVEAGHQPSIVRKLLMR